QDNPRVCSIFPANRLYTQGVYWTFPVMPGAPAISGLVTGKATGGSDSAQPLANPLFPADGRIIAMPDGAPLWLLPAGWQLVCSQYTQSTDIRSSGAFLWGYW